MHNVESDGTSVTPSRHVTDVLHSAGIQVGGNKNAALNVDRILEITGQLGEQSK